MNPFLSIYKSDTVHVFDLNQRGFFPFGIPTNADLELADERYPVIKLDSTYPGCVPNDQEPEMNFEIETGVPIPNKHGRYGSLAKDMREAMSKLEVGQSFFVPATDHKINSLASTLCGVKTGLAPKYFVSRRASFTDPPGLRIWRLE